MLHNVICHSVVDLATFDLSVTGYLMAAPLPNLQFVLLGLLRVGRKSGSDLRFELRELGLSKTGPTFYRLMGRLEDAGFVKGWYEQTVVESQIHRERLYEITGTGVEAWEGTRVLHEAVISRGSVGDSDAVIA